MTGPIVKKNRKFLKLKSNEPFWLVKNGLLHTYPSLNRHIVADILIVGAGITGSLIAHACIGEGYDTVLIDRREVANGSTSATTSMLQYEIDIPLFKLERQIGTQGALISYRACFEAIDQLQAIAKRIRSSCGFRKKDSLYFANSVRNEQWLKKEYEARKYSRLPVEWLTAAEIRARYDLQKTRGGILSHQAASMDAFRFTHDLIHYNIQHGLRVYDKTGIRKISYRPRSVIVTTDYGYTIKAKKIIYCSGFESAAMIKEPFVKLLSTFAIVGEAQTEKRAQLDHTLFWNTASPYLYMRTTDDNRLLIGGGDSDFLDTAKRDAMLDTKQRQLEQQLRRLLPRQEFRTDFVWAGTFGETKDGLPYIGKHPGFPHSIFVLGFGGNGITFSVAGMDMVRTLLHNQKHPLDKYFMFDKKRYY